MTFNWNNEGMLARPDKSQSTGCRGLGGQVHLCAADLPGLFFRTYVAIFLDSSLGLGKNATIMTRTARIFAIRLGIALLSVSCTRPSAPPAFL